MTFENDEFEQFQIKPASQIQSESNANSSQDEFEEYRKIPFKNDKTYQKFYKAPQYTSEQLKNMSADEKRQYVEDLKLEREYLKAKGQAKGIASELSFGFSERTDLGKIEDEDFGVAEGRAIGMIAPVAAVSKLLSLPIKAFQKFYNIGKWGNRALKTGQSFATGASYETAKRFGQGKEFDPIESAITGAEFATIDTLFRGSKAAYNWYKNLGPGSQKSFINGKLNINELPPNSYRIYEEQVAPEIQRIARQEYESLYENAVKQADAEYKQSLSNVKAEHERALFQEGIQKEIADQEYTNKLKQIAAEHEQNLATIEKENDLAVKEFSEMQEAFQKQKTRQSIVKNALDRPVTSDYDLNGKVTGYTEGVPFRPTQPVTPQSSLSDRVGNIFSNQRINNQYRAGERLTDVIRANDAFDYANVNEAYRLSEELNSQITDIHPQLVSDLQNTILELQAIPSPSPPQQQLLNVSTKLLENLADFADGIFTGYRPMNNQHLLEQAKALRYYMDFEFAHANPRGIYQGTLNNIQNSVEASAWRNGLPEAAEANTEARRLYREWAQEYDNDYIRKFRERSNYDFQANLNSTLDTDNFMQVKRILNKSNAGNQLDNAITRSYVEKKLNKFLKDPLGTKVQDLDAALSEMEPVINQDQAKEIRNIYLQDKKAPQLKTRQIKPENIKEPNKPKIKTIESVKIPLKKTPTSLQKPVKIPSKPEVKLTPEIKAVSKRMNITPEQARKMTDSVDGIKKLKAELNKSNSGKEIFKDVGRDKLKRIVHGNNVKQQLTGEQLYKTMNQGNNFEIMAEILGDETALDLLESAEKLNNQRVNVKNLKKIVKNYSMIKTLIIFGLL